MQVWRWYAMTGNPVWENYAIFYFYIYEIYFNKVDTRVCHFFCILCYQILELASRSGRVPDSRSVFSLIFLKSKLRNNFSKLLKFHYPEIKLQFKYKLPKCLSSFLNIRTSSHLLCVLMLSISLRVVAGMPLITVKQLRICRLSVVSIWG